MIDNTLHTWVVSNPMRYIFGTSDQFMILLYPEYKYLRTKRVEGNNDLLVIIIPNDLLIKLCSLLLQCLDMLIFRSYFLKEKVSTRYTLRVTLTRSCGMSASHLGSSYK